MEKPLITRWLDPEYGHRSAHLALVSKDKEEGVSAFLEKRKPVFQGR